MYEGFRSLAKHLSTASDFSRDTLNLSYIPWNKLLIFMEVAKDGHLLPKWGPRIFGPQLIVRPYVLPSSWLVKNFICFVRVEFTMVRKIYTSNTVAIPDGGKYFAFLGLFL